MPIFLESTPLPSAVVHAVDRDARVLRADGHHRTRLQRDRERQRRGYRASRASVLRPQRAAGSAAERAGVPALAPLLEELVRGLEEVIGLAPPAVAPTLARNGLVLTGGAAQLPDLDRFLGGRLRLPVVVARNAQACVATGTGLALDNLQMIRRGQHYIT